MNATDIIIADNTIHDFIIQLLATLIGAFFGFGLVIYWEKRTEKKQIMKIINELTKAILIETKQIQSETILKDSKKFEWLSNEKRFSGFYGVISFASFENLIHSGKLGLFPAELQIKLASLNDRINHYNFFMREALTTHKFLHLDDQKLEKAGKVLEHNLKKNIDVIDELTKEIIPLLEKELDRVKE